MPDKPDPTKDSAFKKVVDYFLRTPPQTQKRDTPKKPDKSQRKAKQRPSRQGRG